MRNDTTLSKFNFRDKNLANLIKEYEYDFNFNDIVAGTVISREHNGMLIDIGADITAFLPIQEIPINTKGEPAWLTVNETREFIIVRKCSHKSYIILSMSELDNIRSWHRIKVMQEEDVTLNEPAIGYNRGGILVNFETLYGFIPNSHFLNKVKKKESVGHKIKCKILELNKQLNRLTLSERCALLQSKAESVKLGNQLIGIVEEIKPYGLLIKVDSIVGLLHKSELRKSTIRDLNNSFKIGDEVQVKVIYVDFKKGRVSFGIDNK